MSSPQANEWLDAMICELRGLQDKDTLEITDRPKNQSVISCRTVLMNKINPDRLLNRKKARIESCVDSRNSV